MIGQTTGRRTLALWLLVPGLLAVELVVPGWLSGGIAYLILVFVALWSPHRRITLIAASVGSVLILASHTGEKFRTLPPWIVLLHCSLWVMALWVTAVAILQRRRTQEEAVRFFNLSLDLLCVAGLDGYLKRVNPAFEKTLGHTAPELLARPYLDFIHPDDRARVAAETAGLSKGIPITCLEARSLCKDGSYRWVAWTSFPAAEEGLFYSVGRDITEGKRGEKALRDLTARLIFVHEEERKHLARELHDDLNQRLTLLAVEGAKLEQQLPPLPDETRARLHWFQEQLGDLSDDIRGMSHQLHPAVLDYLGLAAALEAECDSFSKREGIAVDFRPENVPERVPDEVSLCLYRVAQEALRNVARHAHAASVTVTLAGRDPGIQLAVFDDGVGFDREAVRAKGGLGLVTMEERVRLMNGVFSVMSRPQQGTEVAVHIALLRGADETGARADSG